MLIVFLGCAGVSFPYPIIAPLFLSGEINALNNFAGFEPELLLGLVIAAYPLGMIIGSAVLGGLSDNIGRKKLLSYSLVFTVIGYAICAYAIADFNYLLFLAARFGIGLCEGNVTVARAIAIDLAGEGDKAVALSKINAAVYSGLLAGPILGGTLGSFKMEYVFLMAMVAYIACWIIVLLFIRESKTIAANKPRLKIADILANKIHLQLLLIQLLMAVGTSGAYHFMPVWLSSIHGLKPSEIGAMAALMSVGMILSSLFLVKRITPIVSKEKLYLIFGGSLALLYLLMVTLPPSLSLGVFLLTGIPISLLGGVFPAYVVERLGSEHSGLLLGSLASMTSIASVGIALLGSLALTVSHAAPIALAAVFCGLSCGLFAWTVVSKQRA